MHFCKDKPLVEATREADKNDDVIRVEHMAAKLESVACRLDKIIDALGPVAYPKKTTAQVSRA